MMKKPDTHCYWKIEKNFKFRAPSKLIIQMLIQTRMLEREIRTEINLGKLLADIENLNNMPWKLVKDNLLELRANQNTLSLWPMQIYQLVA